MPQPLRWPLSRLLPWAVRVANSDPIDPKGYFYRVKDILLERYGIPDGHDLQKIEHPCWSCEGTGGLYEPGGCYKCDADGVHRTALVILHRHRLGPYVFHTPGEAVTKFGRIPDDECGGKVKIRGYVRHDRHPWAHEVGLWLLLFYHPRKAFRSVLLAKDSYAFSPSGKGGLIRIPRTIRWCRRHWRSTQARVVERCRRKLDLPERELPF